MVKCISKQLNRTEQNLQIQLKGNEIYTHIDTQNRKYEHKNKELHKYTTGQANWPKWPGTFGRCA